MRVLLAGSRAKERAALRRLLEQDSELFVAGESSEAQVLLVQARAFLPDLVVLDWELPGLRDTELLPALHALSYSIRVVAFSGQVEAHREALAAGVSAFVSKEEPVEHLLNMVRAVGGLSPCLL